MLLDADKKRRNALNNMVGARRTKIIAVDFDGTLCENAWPNIGPEIPGMIERLIRERKNGNKIILWTCRTDERLEEAVKWCKDRGLEFDAVNNNLEEKIVQFGGDCRKIFADIYIDDRNMDMKQFRVYGCT